MRLGLAVGAVAASVLLAGCGFIGASNVDTHGPDTVGTASAGTGGVQTITVLGNERMMFNPNVIKARVGKLAITLKVTGDTPHNLEIPSLHAGTGMVRKGSPGTIEVTLAKPGHYDFVCTYHQKHGMTGVIQVS